MPFPRPTLTEIIQRTFSDISSRVGAPAAILRRSVVGVLARVIAGASHMLHGHLDYIAREANISTAVDTLPMWAAVWGIKRKDAEFASGIVNFIGTVNGSAIPAGTILNRSDGVQYSTRAEVILAAGVASAVVDALLPGTLGDADAGTMLSLVEPIAGINGSPVVAAGGITNGAEVESNDRLRGRLLARIQKPPHGGSASDYEQWTLEVSGVTRAWVYPLYLGPGTVGITFVRDDDTPSMIPSAAEVEAVQVYIDSVRPVTAEVTVFAPMEVPVNFTIAANPNTQAVRDAITAELLDFFRLESVPGGTLFLSRVDEAIGLAQGEVSHVTSVPAANIVRVPGQISILGAITWL